jgi:hypothetical protein
VNGSALRRDRAAFDGDHPAVAVGDAITDVRALLANLDDTVDAAGDLLLAESVHHLVGGNPLRAGLAADAATTGSLPDRFEVIATPRSAATVSSPSPSPSPSLPHRRTTRPMTAGPGTAAWPGSNQRWRAGAGQRAQLDQLMPVPARGPAATSPGPAPAPRATS